MPTCQPGETPGLAPPMGSAVVHSHGFSDAMLHSWFGALTCKCLPPLTVRLTHAIAHAHLTTCLPDSITRAATPVPTPPPFTQDTRPSTAFARAHVAKRSSDHTALSHTANSVNISWAPSQHPTAPPQLMPMASHATHTPNTDVYDTSTQPATGSST